MGETTSRKADEDRNNRSLSFWKKSCFAGRGGICCSDMSNRRSHLLFGRPPSPASLDRSIRPTVFGINIRLWPLRVSVSFGSVILSPIASADAVSPASVSQPSQLWTLQTAGSYANPPPLSLSFPSPILSLPGSPFAPAVLHFHKDVPAVRIS